ncbi:MAG: response regulator transcription factor [Spirochaetes bacterium]|nr:response regulator transcription factor [Spirochaetota bacterium]
MSFKKNRILIVDDHPIVVTGLTQLLQSQADIEVSGQVSSAQGAIDFLKTQIPEMMIVDISLENSNGIELIKNILSLQPQINILVLSMHDETIYAERSIKAGAKGYIMKHKVGDELLKAIYKVLNGKTYLSEEMSEKIISSSIKGEKRDIENNIMHILSDRELEVFELIGNGLTTQEISDKLFLGTKTVETYKTKIKQKLNLKNATQLTKYAVEWIILNK